MDVSNTGEVTAHVVFPCGELSADRANSGNAFEQLCYHIYKVFYEVNAQVYRVAVRRDLKCSANIIEVILTIDPVMLLHVARNIGEVIGFDVTQVGVLTTKKEADEMCSACVVLYEKESTKLPSIIDLYEIQGKAH